MAAVVVFDDQQNAVISTVVNNGANVFITGPGGVGKSAVLKEIVARLKAKGKKVAVVAPTGVAALNVKGKTIHSWAGVGIGNKPAADYVATHVSRRGKRPIKPYENDDVVSRFVNTDTLIIDEVSMVSASLFGKIDVMGRELRLPRHLPTYGLRDYVLQRISSADSKPFGGMQLVVVGDFYQLPPVDGCNDRDTPKCWSCGCDGSVVDEDERLYKCTSCSKEFCGTVRYAFESDPEGRNRWDETGFVVCELTKVHRQKNVEFVAMLHRLRSGEMTPSDIAALSSLSRPLLATPEGVVPTKLLPTNEEVNGVNSVNYARCGGPEHAYAMHTACEGRYGEKLLERNIRNSPFDQRVRLKTNTQVMLRYNLSTDMGLCNGTRGIVKGFVDVADPEAVKELGRSGVSTFGLGAATLMAHRFGTVLPVVSFVIADESEPFVTVVGPQQVSGDDTYGGNRSSFEITQIPLTHAWAITIHKSQGMTLTYVRMDLSRCFEKGQGYTALSRAADPAGLQVEGFEPHRIFCDPAVVAFYRS
jgi:ATP-dependent DNA helicase PIF1